MRGYRFATSGIGRGILLIEVVDHCCSFAWGFARPATKEVMSGRGNELGYVRGVLESLPLGSIALIAG